MIKYIIVALAGFIILALAAIWVLSGGPRRVVTTAKNAVVSAVPSEESQFKLPWQPVEIFPTLDITDALDLTIDEGEKSQAEQLAELEAEYDRLQSEVQTTRTFGNPSPYIGKVALAKDASGVRANDAREEYVQIAANFSNTEPVDITGWTLESALSGVRIQIPPAASPFIANSANVLGSVSLDPGGLALVASAPSPIGVSFRENMCSGYLGQFQQFTPPLSDECPSPTSVLPLTDYNLQAYGEACFDAVANVPVCRFPQKLESVSFACKSYLTDNLSYNGCVQQNRFRSTFQKNMWRIYLGASGEIWRNSHDAIRLLDAEGKTVSVFVY